MRSLNRLKNSRRKPDMTILNALKQGSEKLKKAKIDSAYLDAEILLLASLNRKNGPKDRVWLYAWPEFDLSEAEAGKYRLFITRRSRHEPLAYITGRQEFYGLNFYVNRNALIPRPETEHLIETVAETIKKEKLDEKKIIFIDIATGSGCIPITLSKLLKFKKIYAGDISAKALRLARLNAKALRESKKIIFIQGSLFDPLKNNARLIGAEHLFISANLPYIKTGELKKLPPCVKNYEPALALDGGKSGTDLIKRLLAEISLFCRRHNDKKTIHLFLEIGFGQKSEIAKEITEHFKKAKMAFTKDLSGKYRIIKVAIKPNFC